MNGILCGEGQNNQVYHMIAAVPRLNSLFLNHDKLFIMQIPTNCFQQTWQHSYHRVTWLSSLLIGSHSVMVVHSLLIGLSTKTKQMAVVDLINKFEVNLIEFSSYSKSSAFQVTYIHVSFRSDSLFVMIMAVCCSWRRTLSGEESHPH